MNHSTSLEEDFPSEPTPFDTHRSLESETDAPVAKQYATISLFLLPALGWVMLQTFQTPVPVPESRELLGPIFALLGLTAVVWLLMLIARNTAVIAGIAPVRFFRNFNGAEVPDWVERPARTFNNLMQVPVLFYATCGLMMQAEAVDSVQLALAWTFAISRYAHAIVFVGWNDVKWRFATALVGFLSMGVIAYRFAAATYPYWSPL